MKLRDNLYFPDLLILRVVYENSGQGRGATTPRILNYANEWLSGNRVPDKYSPKLTSHSQRDISLAMLLSLKLIEHLGGNRGYTVTDEGESLIKDMGPDWRDWFMLVPVIDGELQISQATYEKDYGS